MALENREQNKEHTHFLNRVKGGVSRYRDETSKGHTLTRNCSGYDLSSHRKKADEMKVLTSCFRKRLGLVKTCKKKASHQLERSKVRASWNIKERHPARGTYLLERSEVRTDQNIEKKVSQ